MPHEPYASRRAKLLSRLQDGVAIIPTAPERTRNRDTSYPYRFDSYFWYLTGFAEPESVLVLVGGKSPRSILFCRSKDEERETWNGFRYGPTAAATNFGFDEAFSIDDLDEKLPELIANRSALWYPMGEAPMWDQKIMQTLHAVSTQSRSGKRPPPQLCDIKRPLDCMRQRKDAHELSLMKKAASITSLGHIRAMQACRPGMAEYELEAELSFSFRRAGADAHAYPPIVASGHNSCILHYVENNRVMNDQSLVLIDAGCEIHGYAADITRTFPVNGRFEGAQKDAYEIVLAAQKAAFQAIQPGAEFNDYHMAALRVLVQGMVDIGLLSGSCEELIEREAYKPYYMHRTGHWLGIDVHDVGDYRTPDEENNWIRLAPGMVMTVEPGLYISPNADVPEHLKGIGIRIEDDVLVTDTGHDIYTTAPRTIAEIEEIMRH